MVKLWVGLLTTLTILVGHGEASACKPELDGYVQNLAKGRPTFQSSVYSHPIVGWASNAVDGNCNGDWYAKSCIHTNNDLEPWWYVDLEDRYGIGAVVVKNRGDCCGERLDRAQVYVGNNIADPKSNFLCGPITDTSLGSVNTISCYGYEGQYVFIIIPGRQEYLHVCEVEVFGVKGCPVR
nr:fucolectin-like [Anolis sagrei ordinatus]